MKKALVLAAALTVTASVASAGGPVIIEGERPVEVVTEKPRSGMFLPLLLGAVIIAAAASGSGSGS